MKIPIHRPFWVLLAALATSISCWKQVPGTPADHETFEFVARCFFNPPWIVSGTGSHQDPWSLQTPPSKAEKKHGVSATIVAIDDDPEGIFQSSPPSPLDVAVLLNNLHRLGEKKAALAAVIAWDAPDTIGLTALEKTLARFESLTMAAPLSRGTSPEPIHNAFYRASIPITNALGDSSLIPIVNRIAVRGVMLGKENSLAGFQTLDSQSDIGPIPLLARWEDRLVFAFPLIAGMQQLGLPIEGITVQCGRSISLSPQGPILAIDDFGRLINDATPSEPIHSISAANLIDANVALLQRDPRSPLIIRDERSSADIATQRFSEQLGQVISPIITHGSTKTAFTCTRLDPPREIALLIALALILSATSALTIFPRNVMLLTIAAFLVSAQFIAASLINIWLSGMAALASVAAAFIISSLIPDPKKS